jgi:hypothetical protein
MGDSCEHGNKVQVSQIARNYSVENYWILKRGVAWCGQLMIIVPTRDNTERLVDQS